MTVFEFLFHIQSDVFVHRSVVTCDEVPQEGAQPLDQGLRHFPRVGKHKRRGMCADEVSNGLNVVLEDFHHGKIAEFWVRDENVQIQFARTRYFGDGNLGGLPSSLSIVAADEVFCYRFQRFHGGGNTDALDRILQQRVQHGQGEREMDAALGGDHGVQFIDDHVLHFGNDRLEAWRGDGDGEAFGRGDEDVRWGSQHLLAFGLRCVTGSQPYPNVLGPVGKITFLDFLERADQVALNVVGQGFDG